MNFITRLRCLALAGLMLTIAGCGQKMVDYVSEEGKFRVQMPEEPVPFKDPKMPMSVKKVWVQEQSGSYAVAWEDLPASDDSPDKRLDDACDASLKALNTKETKKRKDITLAGKYPGRELIMEVAGDREIVHDRMYLVGRRLYHVVVSGSRWWVEKDVSSRMFDSFEVIEE